MSIQPGWMPLQRYFSRCSTAHTPRSKGKGTRSNVDCAMVRQGTLMPCVNSERRSVPPLVSGQSPCVAIVSSFCLIYVVYDPLPVAMLHVQELPLVGHLSVFSVLLSWLLVFDDLLHDHYPYRFFGDWHAFCSCHMQRLLHLLLLLHLERRSDDRDNRQVCYDRV
jgi:hypothetical protein